MNGADVLLLAQTGEDPTSGDPVYTVVGSQRDVTFGESNATIDVSHKGSRAGQFEYGRYTSTVSLDALYVPTDTAYQALKTASRNGETIKVRRQEAGADLEEADAIVTSMSQTFPDQDAATISVELQITGDWVPVA